MKIGDLVKIAPHATPDEASDPRSKPGIVIDITKLRVGSRASATASVTASVMWPDMSKAEAWIEDALVIVTSKK